MAAPDDIQRLEERILACRLCRDHPTHGPALPHEPSPVLQLGAEAPICIAGQAPGNRAHQHQRPFWDPSGDRLRRWLDVDEATFYDPRCFNIVPMGFCFPGYDAKGGDLPPRPECVQTWHDQVFEHLPRLRLILVIGQYAQRYHLRPEQRQPTLTETVANWRSLLYENRTPAVLPLPHPSWRNNAWLKKHPWFEGELLPVLQAEIRTLLKSGR